jgi:cold shock protein
MQGTVKWFNEKKGFGFIQSAGKDVFVHHTAIKAKGFRTLVDGQTVTFEMGESDKGPVAKNVVPDEAPFNGPRATNIVR